MTAPLLLTFKDLLDLSTQFLGALNQAVNQPQLRGCIQTAYDELAEAHKWTYLKKSTRIVTVAPQTTGTIQYTFSSNQLVLTGAQWPSWANQGSVNIANVVSEIVSVANDDVTATLDNVINPGQDVAAGTSYSVYQDSYLMPSDFQLCAMPIAENYVRFMQMVRPDEWLSLRRVRQAVGQPTLYTFFQDTRYYNNIAIGFYPAPDRIMTVDVIYKALPRRMKFTGTETGLVGTATITAGANLATINTGTLSSDHVGSIFRVRTDSTEPTGRYGLAPFDEQKVITAVSGSSITLDTAFSKNYTTGKFIVSDPVDISPNMVAPMIRGAERQLAIVRRMDRWERIEAEYFEALKQAKSADNRSNQRQSMWDSYPSVSRRIARMPRGPDL